MFPRSLRWTRALRVLRTLEFRDHEMYPVSKILTPQPRVLYPVATVLLILSNSVISIDGSM